eukprot:gene8952-1289_t
MENNSVFDNNNSSSSGPGESTVPQDLPLTILISVLSVAWVTFITFYASRCFGFVVTKIIQWRWKLRDGSTYFQIGSLYFSPLAGRLVFRDVRFFTTSFALSVVDGYFRLRYWSADDPNPPGMSKSSRIIFQLNGLSYHVYNHDSRYSELQKLLQQS